jgi:hypothetical protein
MPSNVEQFDHNLIEIPGVTCPRDPLERDKWIRDKVQESLMDPRPSVPHDQLRAARERSALVGASALNPSSRDDGDSR